MQPVVSDQMKPIVWILALFVLVLALVCGGGMAVRGVLDDPYLRNAARVESALVAPVSIGEGAFVGSGSVITQDVPGDALALARTAQATREGWAEKFRTLMQRRKAQAK